MTELTKGMVVLASVKSPLPETPARIVFAGLGEGALSGKTLFDVFVGDMYYGFFALSGSITVMDYAQSRLLAPVRPGDDETVAQYFVRRQWVCSDDNEFYAAGC